MSRIFEMFGSLIEEQPVVLLVNIALLGVLIYSFYLIFSYEAENRAFRNFIDNVGSGIKTKEQNLIDEFNNIKKESGEFKDKNRYRKITTMLNDSGIKIKHPTLSTFTFILGVILADILLSVIMFLITKSFIVVIACIVGVPLLTYVVLTIKINNINKDIENELIKFVNLLANMSRSENNLAEMFGATIKYLNNPLKVLVSQCYYEMKSTGDTITALRHFEEKANHKKLKEVINYFITCSTHNESYETVIYETKESIRNYIAYKKEKANIKRSSLIDMFIMAIGGVAIIYAISQMMPGSIDILLHDIIGQVLLGAAGLLLLISCWIVFKADND